jgi:hypothetical protein
MKHFPILGSLATCSGRSSHHSCRLGVRRRAESAGGPRPGFLLYSAQGYLGVDLGEVDSDRATRST